MGMKLLVLARSSRVGGGTRWTENFARGMNARGHDCRVAFTRIGTSALIFHQRLSDIIYSSICYRYLDPGYPGDLAVATDSFAPDYLLVDNGERLQETMQYSSRLATGQTKVVFIAHTQGTPAGMLESMGVLLWKVVCVSQKSADMLPGFSPAVIRNGAVEPPTEGHDIRELLDIPENAAVVGYIGRHDDNKGVGIIPEAATQLGWWSLMAGPGAECGPGPNDKYYPLSIENVGDWYRALDVFVLPSREEGFPLAPMEALLCGTRVAMTPTSDYPECFSGAVSFFDHGDVGGLLRAIETAPDPSIGQEIITRDFTIDRMLDQYEEVLSHGV